MSWTESDITALESAIKQGTVRVKFADREITYRSLDDMLKLRDTMISAVRGRKAAKVYTPEYDRGYQ